MKKLILSAVVLLVMAACGTKQAAVNETKTTAATTTTKSAEQLQLDYMRRVYDNAVYVQNIVSNIDFTLKTGEKNISVSGSLRMRKDDVIRIQLTAFGLMEVGRLEFTKDYVMIVDRIHKEYIKADYNKVDFLQRKGLNFYSLQALFWNTLFLPGAEKVTDELLQKFVVDLASSSSDVPVSLKQGNMNYQWLTDSKTARIRQTNVTYSDKTSGTTRLTCNYDNFKPLGTKMYPNTITLNAQTEATKKARNASITIQMDGVKTDSDWETRTTLSGKYKQVSVEEVLSKITAL